MTSHVKQLTASIAATTTTANAPYPASNANGVWIYNSGTVPVFVNSGTSTVTATSTNQVVQAGAARLLERDANDTHLAALASTGTATVYFHATQSVVS